MGRANQPQTCVPTLGLKASYSPSLHNCVCNVLVMLLCADHIKTEVDATNTPNDEKEGENAENSVAASQKSTRSRYMSATASAKAKARTSPKTRVEGEESPAKLQKRLSFGSPSVGRTKSPNLHAAARSKSISQVSHTAFKLWK